MIQYYNSSFTSSLKEKRKKKRRSGEVPSRLSDRNSQLRNRSTFPSALIQRGIKLIHTKSNEVQQQQWQQQQQKEKDDEPQPALPSLITKKKNELKEGAKRGRMIS